MVRVVFIPFGVPRGSDQQVIFNLPFLRECRPVCDGNPDCPGGTEH